jgi:invasion protein IalB
MLATIDEHTAMKVDRDRKVHGAAFACVLPDGCIVHVPASEVLPCISSSLVQRLESMTGERVHRTAKATR